MSLSSGSYIVSQATLVGLTGDCYCCYILMQLFSAGNLKDLRVHRGCSLSRMSTFCWINNRPCKHLGTAPSLVKIISFKYFRESSHLKQVSEHSFAVKCFPSPRRIA